MAMKNLVRLYARQKIDEAGMDEFKVWATECLASGHDSPVLRSLSTMGKGKNGVAAAKRDLLLAINDLQIKLPPLNQIFNEYAVAVAEDMAAMRIPPSEGMSILSKLYRSGNFSDQSLGVWYDLDDACKVLLSEESYSLFSELNAGNIDAYLIAEAKLFLAFRPLTRPPNFNRWRYCRQCGYLGLPAHREVKASFFRKIFDLPDYSMYQPYCSSCGNQKLWGMRTQEARIKYLESQKHKSDSPPEIK